MIILFILNLFVYTQIFKLKVENYVFQLTNDVCWRIAFLMLVSFRIFPNFASRFLIQNLPPPYSPCIPVMENSTHSAMFVAWSPMRSKYLAIIKTSMAYSPESGFWWIMLMRSFFIRQKNSSMMSS